MGDIKITLEGLLAVIAYTKPITVNLFDENDLLLITFVLAGYDCLDDFLMDDEVKKFEVVNMQTVNITIDTSLNGL